MHDFLDNNLSEMNKIHLFNSAFDEDDLSIVISYYLLTKSQGLHLILFLALVATMFYLLYIRKVTDFIQLPRPFLMGPHSSKIFKVTLSSTIRFFL